MGIVIPYRGYIEANLIIPGLLQYNEGVFFFWLFCITNMGKGTCTNRYPGHRSFGSDDNCIRVTAGWGYRETGAPKHCNFKEEYREEFKCP